jgi:hypothetical protein
MDAGRPATYDAAEALYRGTSAARERFEELVTRNLLAGATAALAARGEYDPARHGTFHAEPLTAAEHLETLALGEMLARYYRHPSRVHDAVRSGATWRQIAVAVGAAEPAARQAYRDWADAQHSLWHDYEGRFGLSDAEHGEAVRRATAPDREAGL